MISCSHILNSDSKSQLVPDDSQPQAIMDFGVQHNDGTAIKKKFK